MVREISNLKWSITQLILTKKKPLLPWINLRQFYEILILFKEIFFHGSDKEVPASYKAVNILDVVLKPLSTNSRSKFINDKLIIKIARIPLPKTRKISISIKPSCLLQANALYLKSTVTKRAI